MLTRAKCCGVHAERHLRSPSQIVYRVRAFGKGALADVPHCNEETGRLQAPTGLNPAWKVPRAARGRVQGKSVGGGTHSTSNQPEAATVKKAAAVRRPLRPHPERFALRACR